MSNIVETVGCGGGYEVEIDHWGGCHFHYPDAMEQPLSLSPQFMNQIIEAREKVLREEEE